MSNAVDRLPQHLKQYIDQQNYDQYTQRDHAVWRYILRQNVSYFANKGYAVPEYANGLKLTGIPLGKIPRISEMDASLEKFGWGAVPVCGFIPPIAFLEFQSHGVLPIAHNMRNINHIGYTPAPDIVHESAGHAPILVNEVYADYLKRYAEVAKKAISSKKYFQQYEAIRKLSDLKELPGVSATEIEKAEHELHLLKDGAGDVSESAQVIRLYWWTAEYGLFGDMNAPKVFGAGLLSSVDESQNCLSARVRKIPFSIDCIHYAYDITEAQPQLFVVRKFEDLLTTLDDMEKLLAYKRGGTYGIKKALESETVVTIKWLQGALFSGIVSKHDSINDSLDLIQLTGPIQIGFNETLMEGNLDISRENWVLPIGTPKLIQSNQVTKKSSEIKMGDSLLLHYGDSLSIEGKVTLIKSNDLKIGMLKLENVLMNLKGVKSKLNFLFVPFGAEISSVFGGPYDQNLYQEYDVGKASTKPVQNITHSSKKLALFDMYERVYTLGNNMQENDFKRLCHFIDQIFETYPKEWLLWVEVLQMLSKNQVKSPVISELMFEIQERIKSSVNNLSQSEIELLQKELLLHEIII